MEFRGLHENGFSVGYVDEFAGWLSQQLRLKAAGFHCIVHSHIGSSHINCLKRLLDCREGDGNCETTIANFAGTIT